ncbi:unnamed protein product [Effrenium voratum]|nr:unnamed protein product [Effrenium voratum]
MEKYSFVQRLGQGSFAVVWKARRKSDGRLVAVKQLKQSPESWEACKQLPEVRAAAVPDRRHLVQLLEAVRHGGELFLVFEYIEGSLHHCIATATRRLEDSQIRWAARRLLMALAAVHAAGLVHCDVKPENILVGGTEGRGAAPTMKLCDFGQSGPPGEIATYIGTRWYRAPELFLGSRGDASVDLWSAGCTIAELILRRPLVPGSDTRDMLFRICGELGAPEECWPLAHQLVEASGRANAEPAAWQSLRDQHAPEAAVELLAGLLQYDGARRTRADRALREGFLAPGLAEAPLPVPAARPQSPSSLQRAREEAQAVERRLAGKATLPPPPPPSSSPPSPVPGPCRTVPSAKPGESTTPSSPAVSCREAESEDEALADAFWNTCKAAPPPAVPPPRPRPPAPASIALASRQRMARPKVGLSMAPRSTDGDSPVPPPRHEDEAEDHERHEHEEEEADPLFRHPSRPKRTVPVVQPMHGHGMWP